MRTLLAISAVLALGGVLPACSALGLDNLPQADCVRGTDGVSGDAFCASLSTLVPTPDDCHTWQCNEQTRHCEQLARDDDGDGAPSMMCAAGATPDCDDSPATGANDTPGGTETCDGLDQNCDGVPDDGVSGPTMPASVRTTIMAAPDQLVMTARTDADEAFLLSRYMNNFHTVQLAPAATPSDLAFTQPPAGAITLQQADGAVAPLAGGTYAFVGRRTVTAGCQQFALFPVTGGVSSVALRATDESLLPACSGAQQVTAPAIAGNASGTSGTLLLAWLDGTDDARSCGAAPARTVRIAPAQFDARATAHNRIGNAVVTLGESVDNGPPVLLALGGDAFLVAYAKADGTIDVHLVTVDATTAIPAITASDVVYSEPAHPMTQGVGLALGPTTGSATSVALSYYVGCPGMNPITVRMLTRNGASVTGSTTAETNIGTGLARSRVQVAYQPRSSDWIVAWRSASGLSAQRLFEDGSVAGPAFDVVTSSSVSTFVVEPLSRDALYRAVFVDGTSVSSVDFGCAPP